MTTTWTHSRSGRGCLDLTLPDGSLVRYTPGWFFTQARLTHDGIDYRLAGWKVWRGGEHILTVHLLGIRGTIRGIVATATALWRAGREGRYDTPIPPVEKARVSVVGADAEFILSQQDRLYVASAGNGQEVLAIQTRWQGLPYEVRVAGCVGEYQAPLLLALTYLAFLD